MWGGREEGRRGRNRPGCTQQLTTTACLPAPCALCLVNCERNRCLAEHPDDGRRVPSVYCTVRRAVVLSLLCALVIDAVCALMDPYCAQLELLCTGRQAEAGRQIGARQTIYDVTSFFNETAGKGRAHTQFRRIVLLSCVVVLLGRTTRPPRSSQNRTE